MRNIKFRMYVKVTKKMFEVGKLDLQYNKVYAKNHPQSYFRTEDVELMQYTGLKDKNGKEIYEGDIVKVFSDSKWIVGKVIYEHCEFIVDVMNNKDLNFGRVGIIERFTEVIGNKFDNPDLLKKGAEDEQSR